MGSEKKILKNPLKTKTWGEFKKFISSRGNLIDLAVAVIVGAAFSAIVTSLVNDIFMPLITAAIGKSLNDLIWVANGVEPYYSDGTVNPTAIIIKYGNFIQAVINFIIIALIMFAVVKAYMSFRQANKNKFCGFSADEYFKLKKEGKSRKEIKALAIQNKERLLAQAEQEKLQKEKNSVEGILKDIRSLLEKQVGSKNPSEALKDENNG